MIIIIKILILVFLLWVFYLEINPSITNVWLRPNEKGDITFCPQNIFNFLIQPFKCLWMWNPRFWDINFYTFFIVCYILYSYIKEFWKIHKELISWK